MTDNYNSKSVIDDRLRIFTLVTSYVVCVISKNWEIYCIWTLSVFREVNNFKG